MLNDNKSQVISARAAGLIGCHVCTRVNPEDKKFGDNWLGLVKNEAYITQNSRRKPLAPTILYFLLSIFY